MKTYGWISFKYKLPYSNVNGGPGIYNYPVIVVCDTHILGHESFLFNDMLYYIMPADTITHIYEASSPDIQQHILAWIPLEVYG